MDQTLSFKYSSVHLLYIARTSTVYQVIFQVLENFSAWRMQEASKQAIKTQCGNSQYNEAMVSVVTVT